MSTLDTMYVVMTSSQDSYATISCIGAFEDADKAKMYAVSVMEENLRAEGTGLEIGDIEQDTGQYMLVLSHEEIDFKVIIDYCPRRA